MESYPEHGNQVELYLFGIIVLYQIWTYFISYNLSELISFICLVCGEYINNIISIDIHKMWYNANIYTHVLLHTYYYIFISGARRLHR